MTHGPLCLVSFLYHHVFKSHPCSVCQDFIFIAIPLQENTTFCLPIHQLMDIWVVYTLVIMNNTLTNSCVKVFV